MWVRVVDIHSIDPGFGIEMNTIHGGKAEEKEEEQEELKCNEDIG